MSRRTRDPFGRDYIFSEECEHCGLPVEPRNNEESCECEESIEQDIASYNSLRGNYEERRERRDDDSDQ